MKPGIAAFIAYLGVLVFHHWAVKAYENGPWWAGALLSFATALCFWGGVFAYHDLKMKPFREGVEDLQRRLRQYRENEVRRRSL